MTTHYLHTYHAAHPQPKVTRRVLTRERLDVAVLIAADLFEIEAKELRGRSRTRAVSPARLALYVALYDGCDTTLEEIGGWLNRDHTSVLYGIGQARQRMTRDPWYAGKVEQIKTALQGGQMELGL
jgi:chromosomal replication initiation ATPase DnaA